MSYLYYPYAYPYYYPYSYPYRYPHSHSDTGITALTLTTLRLSLPSEDPDWLLKSLLLASPQKTQLEGPELLQNSLPQELPLRVS